MKLCVQKTKENVGKWGKAQQQREPFGGKARKWHRMEMDSRGKEPTNK
jgi:hypothetical protein